jgi:hypothetical protein
MTQRTVLSRANILSAKDIVTRDVPCPEWAPEGATEEEKAGCVVVIRNLTGAGRAAFIQLSMEMKKAEESNKKVEFEIEQLLVCMTAVDEQGVPLFTREDMEALGQRNAICLTRCAEVASELAGLDKAAKAAVGKASPSTPS